MITRIWSGASRLYWLLLPLSCLYGLTMAFIRFIYRYGLCKVHHFPLPIVVVGNLTVGGTGKTPVVLWLVMQLKQRGWRVGVVSRGYGGYPVTNCYPLLVDSNTSSDLCGDEPLLIHQRTGVPVAVAPRRAQAVAALLRAHTLDIIITDDGLQHYSLGRDIEWVIIDGKRRFGNGWWLPAGPMRERVWRLQTVHAVIVNGSTNYPGEVPMHFIAGKAVNLLSGECCALNDLLPLVAIAGIAYPQNFFATLHAYGIIPIQEISFKDHQVYQKHMLDKLVTSKEYLLMTEKDAVKCRSFACSNWWYLPINVEISVDAQETLLAPILKLIKHY